MKILIILFMLMFSCLAQPDLTGYSFCIDPGHGGSDPGATGPTGWQERVTNDRVAYGLADYLNRVNADTVVLTRTTNITLSLSQREAIANNAGVDMFHSVHHNWASNPATDYTLVLYEELTIGNPQWPGESDVLSDSMSARLSRFQEITDIGGRGDLEFLGYNLGVLNDLNMPGQLSEGNFISNPLSEARHKSMPWCHTEAQALLYAILDYYGSSLPDYATLIGTVRNKTDNSPANNTYCTIIENGQEYTTDANDNGFFKFDSLTPGTYTVRVLLDGDTLDNPVSLIAGDIKPVNVGGSPEQPVLKYVNLTASDSVEVAWYPSTDPLVHAFRIYQSTDGSSWSINLPGSYIAKMRNSFRFDIAAEQAVYYKLCALNIGAGGDTVESEFSDSYGIRINADSTQVLIVDGFDRNQTLQLSGSWAHPQHNFAVYNGNAIIDIADIGFASCANDAVIDGSIDLNDYRTVIWILGDESTTHRTFDTSEINHVKAFLENGGNFFVSGSEVGWDVGRAASPNADLNFYNNYLKAGYLADDSGNLIANGVSGSIFDGLSVTFGVTYPEDYPDVIQTSGGSSLCVRYGNNQGAAVNYAGTFGSSSTPGKLVYIAFPFETIGVSAKRAQLMGNVLDFFGYAVNAVPEKIAAVPQKYVLYNNYPNPFNPRTTIKFYLPQRKRISLHIFNLTGQKVYTIIENRIYDRGTHQVSWDGSNSSGERVASGTYYYILRFDRQTISKSMVLLK